MPFFDAHCDTVMRAFDSGLDFVAGGKAHVDLPRLLAAGGRVQLFAVFAARSYFPGRDVRAYADEAIETIRGWVEGSGGRVRLALTPADIRAACGGGGLYALLGLEGADPLEDRADNLARFYRAGVRHVIAAWDDNAFSGTSMGAGGPLTPEGAKLIEFAEALHMMVDVSHLSDTAFAQVCDIARRPFIASHSNCRALCPSPRNLTDEMIQTIAERGGVMGINLSADYVDPGYLVAWDALNRPARAAIKAAADPETRAQLKRERLAVLQTIPLPDMAWIVRHVRHAIAVGGEECIGLGGDLDGIEFMPAGITGIESYPLLAESLLAAGLTAAQVEKICWRNMARVFEEVL